MGLMDKFFYGKGVWVFVIIMVAIAILIFSVVNNKVNKQYDENCFKNDTIKDIINSKYNCEVINCQTRSCLKFVYDNNETKIVTR